MSEKSIHPQAAVFRALADHLDLNPTLPCVNVLPGINMPELHIASDGIEGAAAVLVWAKTLAEPVVTIKPLGEKYGGGTTVFVTGGLGEVEVEAWDVDRGDLYRLYDLARATDWRKRSPITLDDLARYVATGVLEAI